MSVDFGKTAADYARHRLGFPERFFERLFAAGFIKQGDRVLDLGTGTGTIARSLALRGCSSVGLDRSQPLLAEAQRLDKEAGVSVGYVVATAENTGLPSSSFDAVTAGQCWHWFDRAKAAVEARRVLKPGGVLVIAHFSWIPLPENVAWITEKLIEKHNPEWKLGGSPGMYPHTLTEVALGGFGDIETFSFDEPTEYTHEDWRGRIRASAGVAATLSPEAVVKFDAELQSALAAKFPEDPMIVPHRTWAMIARSPSNEKDQRL